MHVYIVYIVCHPRPYNNMRQNIFSAQTHIYILACSINEYNACILKSLSNTERNRVVKTLISSELGDVYHIEQYTNSC